MPVRISLNNYNQPGGTLEVFRSTERMDEANMPEPIAILDSDVVEFIDNSPLLYGVDYNYATRITSASGDVHPVMFGRNVRLSRNNGYGCQDILSGDETLGYMGMITSDDDAYGILLSVLPTNQASFSRYVNFIKYIRNGIISYTPTVQIATLTNNVVGNSGKMFGGSARDALVQHASVLKMRNDTSAMKEVVGGDIFSVHIPVLFRDGDVVDQNFFADTPDSEYNTAPPGKWEALDYWRMFSQTRSISDRKMAPVNYNHIGANALIFAGSMSPTSSSAGMLSFQSRIAPPRPSTNNSYVGTSPAALNFIIEHESSLG